MVFGDKRMDSVSFSLFSCFIQPQDESNSFQAWLTPERIELVKGIKDKVEVTVVTFDYRTLVLLFENTIPSELIMRRLTSLLVADFEVVHYESTTAKLPEKLGSYSKDVSTSTAKLESLQLRVITMDMSHSLLPLVSESDAITPTDISQTGSADQLHVL
jgi:hypothetical protein